MPKEDQKKSDQQPKARNVGAVVMTPQALGPDMIKMLKERSQRERAEREAESPSEEKP
jgi:hypothetical protein